MDKTVTVSVRNQGKVTKVSIPENTNMKVFLDKYVAGVNSQMTARIAAEGRGEAKLVEHEMLKNVFLEEGDIVTVTPPVIGGF